MARTTTAAVLLFALCVPIEAWTQLADIQRSHIEGNVPSPESFDAFLRRDLMSYFQDRSTPFPCGLEYTFLRNGPTQSGVSYPKFYLWVRVIAGKTAGTEGAVRVEAIAQTHFEVTDFMHKEAIIQAPGTVGSVFPAALVHDITARAEAR
jgi:hypothetical protein